MKARYVVLLMIGSIVITGSAIAFGYFLSQEEVVEEEVSSEPQSSGSAGTGGLQVTTSGGNQGLQGFGDVAGESTDGGQLPTPDQFEVYEQYAQETSALYQTVRAGSGRAVEPGDVVQVLYRGWLTDGTLFDQSFDAEGNPRAFEFQVGAGQVIPGWDQGIAGMQEGEVRRLVIPSTVGYGEEGQGPIPANALLIFDVELLSADSQSAVESGL